MGKYLTKEERFYIEKALKMKVPVIQIAKELGKARSTIYKEIKRGKCIQRNYRDWSEKVVYLSDVAHNDHVLKSHNKGTKKKFEKDDIFLQMVSDKILNEKYSPEACIYVFGHKCCAKTIYNYIHANYIKGVKVINLPYAKLKKKKKGRVVKREFTRGRIIDVRPESIDSRSEYGHWEMDTVYSSKDDLTCLLVLSDRCSRDEIVFKIKNRTSKAVLSALNKYEKQIGAKAFREKFKTITCDNGMEFANWQGIEKSAINKGNRTITYFCHPYSSWERGTNENINRMIRRWIPKGDDIGLYSDKEIEHIMDWINNYPRKIFGGLSSKQYREMILNV